MNKNLLVGVIVILLLACLGEGYWINRERNEKLALGMSLGKTIAMMTPKPPTGSSRPMPMMKGSKFADNPLSSKAYLIAPATGALSADAQKATTGWTITSKDNGDSTTTVTLTPKEAEDVQQVFTLKSGDKLYFIEMTLIDDTTGVDENRADDMGVLVDQNGIVQ